MADLSPLLGEERKSDFGAVRSVDETRSGHRVLQPTSGCAIVRNDGFHARVAGEMRLHSIAVSRLSCLRLHRVAEFGEAIGKAQCCRASLG
jgi:hypothetical protein